MKNLSGIKAILILAPIVFISSILYLNISEIPETDEIEPSQITDRSRDHEGDTFSIVAYDAVTGEIGGAGCSCFSGTIDFLSDLIRDGSGNLLGAIHSQAAYLATNQANARTRMLAGDSAQEIVDWLEANDCCSSTANSRQYGVVRVDGGLETAGFTGSSNGNWAGDIQGISYSIQGNILDTSTGGAGRQDILNDMESAFLNSTGTLADKLMAALQGAKRVGGDNRCTNAGQSGRAAFVKVLRPSDPNDSSPYIDISVYPNVQFQEPIDVLQCAYDVALNTPNCRQTVSTFPYTMDFETQSWEEEETCSIRNSWIRSRFASPTANTGPSGPNEGAMYTFVESSDLGPDNFNNRAVIGSPCFNIPIGEEAIMTFDYHMDGNNMGTLSVTASDNDGSSWTTLWSQSGDKGASWLNATIDLSTYAGSTVKLRFDATTGNGELSDMAIDDVQIVLASPYCTSSGTTSSNRGITNVTLNTINNSDGPTKDVGYENFTAISTDLEQGSNHDLSVSVNTVTNTTMYTKAWIDWNNDFDFDDAGEEYDLGTATNVSSGTTSLSPLNISVSGSATLGTKRMRVSTKRNSAPTSCETSFDGEVEDYSINIIIPFVPVSCSNSVGSLPYAESFENTFGIWTQASGDDGNWLNLSGGTPSTNTGPSSANHGSYYIYIESSTPATTTGGISTNATAIIESPCIDLSTYSNVQFSFDYHTYGATLNPSPLTLEGSVEDGVWFNLFTAPGVSQNLWINEVVDLSSYTQNIKLRFVGNTGTSFTSDVAVDNINIYRACPTSVDYNGGWTGATPTNSTSVNIITDYDTSLNGGSIDACDLTVSNGATLTIEAGDYLSVNGDIVVNGTLIVKHQGVVVQSDEDATVTKGGGATINVELTSPTLAGRDFMIMGSPMDVETDAGVFGSALYLLGHTPANFLPHPSVPAGGTNFADNNQNFWSPYTGTITPGEGYLVRPQASATAPAQTYDFTYSLGTLNNGDITRTMFYNPAIVAPNATPNILANPYASPISADDFINGNALVDEIYLWEHVTPPGAFPGSGAVNYNMEDISMYNLSGWNAPASDPTSTNDPTVGPEGLLSTGQGFGIKVDQASPTSVTFTNAMRRTAGNTTLRTPDDVDKIWLRVASDAYQLGSTTLVAFNPKATSNRDAGYDSDRLATIVSLYSHLPNGNEQLAIQTREAFEHGAKIPMGFSSQVTEETTYTISISEITGAQLSTATVYLIDNYQGIITNLSEGDYSFRSNKGTFNERFTLQFEPDNTLATADTVFGNVTIYPNPASDMINIIGNNFMIDRVIVYDLLGKVVLQKELLQNQSQTIDISNLNSGLYMIKIHSEEKILTQKLLKK